MSGLDGFFSRQGVGADWTPVSAWAKRSGHSFRRERDGNGFIVDGGAGGDPPWRLEWGPSQRPYIKGRELRLRVEAKLPRDVQLLLMTQPLMEHFEKVVYEQFTRNNQTELGDETTPEEMRWLVMFPKLELPAGRLLRESFGGVSSLPTDGVAWLATPLAGLLERAASSWLRDRPPFLIVTVRGRVYLRLQLPAPDLDAIVGAVGIFECATAEAIRIGATRGEEQSTDWRSRLDSFWQHLKQGSHFK